MSEGKITKVTAPMVGKVIKVNVKQGDKVNQDQPMVIFESMKIEMEIMAPVAGTVKEISVAVGQAIEAEQTLVTIES
ncbi:MAG: biotin/lipoyl-binding protein [Planctomycetes bacterium]|nr:biotin/lipoyl-binding protein [Planctomycetota bacterium]